MTTSEYFASLVEAKDSLRLPSSTPHLRRCVESVNDRLARTTGYVPADSACTQDLDGGGCYLFLHHRPITSITEIRDLATQTVMDASDYEQRGAERDCVYLAGGHSRWPDGQMRWRVTYVAGTDTPPAVLRSIALAMIEREYSVGQENAQPPMTQDEIDSLLRDYYRMG